MATIVIPAREKSTRLPDKLLIKINGKPIIRWTVENCLNIKNIDRVVVATDSERIKESLKDLDIDIYLTPNNIKSGSDRIAYVLKFIEDDNIINVQGDEPLVNPEDIEKLAEVLKNEEITTLAYPLRNEEDFNNPNIVKVVLDKNNYALYFSRSPIPYPRDIKFDDLIKNFKVYKHIGIYGYKKDVLYKFAYKLGHSPVEDIEKLEQLRFLYNGYRIKVIEARNETVGIDTEEDLKIFKQLLNQGKF